MKTINRNGLVYEIITTIITPYQAAIPSVFDEEGNEISPEIPEVEEVSEDTETGKIIGIEVDIPPSDLIATEHSRKLKLLSITAEIDGEIILQSQINYFIPNGTKLMAVAIDEDNTLSAEAKTLKKRSFRAYTLTPKSTRDSFVDPQTGDLVEEGGIPELQYFQNITKEDLVNLNPELESENRLKVLEYHMIAYMLQIIYQRLGI